MKKYCTVLFFTLVLCVLIGPMAVLADEYISADDNASLGGFVEEDLFGMPPSDITTFVYKLGDEWAYLRETIGPCDCQDGYLYVKVKSTGQIIEISDEPVIPEHTVSNDNIYCITESGKLVQTDFLGKAWNVLYQGKTDDIKAVIHYNNKIFFADGNDVMVYDLKQKRADRLTSAEDIFSILPCDDNVILIRNSNAEYRMYSVSTDFISDVLPMSEVEAIMSSSEKRATDNADSSINAAPTNDLSLPLSGWGNGSFFTTDKKPCYHDSENDTGKCKSYKSSYQCMGFAKMASE